LAALLADSAPPDAVGKVCRRWRLSNQLTDRAEWLSVHRGCLKDAQSTRWSVLQKILISPGIEELLRWTEVEAAVRRRESPEVDYCRARLAQPCGQLDPPPLVTGDDLLRHGVAPGPIFGELLAQLRDAQLDSQIHSKDEGMAMVDRLLEERGIRDRIVRSVFDKSEGDIVDKKTKKKLQTLNQRLQKLRGQLAGAKKQMDDPAEVAVIEKQIAEVEAELAKLKGQ
jgi:hypothetical protein